MFLHTLVNFEMPWNWIFFVKIEQIVFIPYRKYNVLFKTKLIDEKNIVYYIEHKHTHI